MIYLLVFIVLGLSLIDAPLQSGGWLWDMGNVLGFVGFAGLLYLFIDSGFGITKLEAVLYAALIACVIIAEQRQRIGCHVPDNQP